MSLPELNWRLWHHCRRTWDHALASTRRRPVRLRRVLRTERDTGILIGQSLDPGWAVPGVVARFPTTVLKGRDELISRADRILSHHIDLFDLRDVDLGAEIDWNYEYKARRNTPMGFAPGIDYRDYDTTGDCKFVWELNRHPQWVVLGRAYRLTGRRAYAEAVVEQMISWLEQCPYGYGMNWRSPLELAIRLINWVWTLELIRPSGLPEGRTREAVFALAYRHIWDISRNYSCYSSANNHLVGEAAGVFIGSSVFDVFAESRRWQGESRAILECEIVKQTYPDGGNREQATGYHLFVLELLLLAGVVARKTGEDFSSRYWNHLERMFTFLAALGEGGDNLPMLGDCDDGYVIDLEDGGRRDRSMLAVGAALFGRSDLKALAGDSMQRVYWLLGDDGLDRLGKITVEPAPTVLQSRSFPETGLYILQSGRGDSDRVSVTFDCGELGMGSIAAHGHADALGITLRLNGSDVLVDPGTFDYYTYPEWRTWFRSTRGHNTIEIDGQDQSQMLGPFLWGRRVYPRCLQWLPTPDGGTVVGAYEGRGTDGRIVAHRRSVTLNWQERTLALVDELSAMGAHRSVLAFHFGEEWSLAPAGPGEILAFGCTSRIRMILSIGLSTAAIPITPELGGGWVSRGYHRRLAGEVLLASASWMDQVRIQAQIVLC